MSRKSSGARVVAERRVEADIAAVPEPPPDAADSRSNGYLTCFGGPRMTLAEEAWENLYRMPPEEREQRNNLLLAFAESYGPAGP